MRQRHWLWLAGFGVAMMSACEQPMEIQPESTLSRSRTPATGVATGDLDIAPRFEVTLEVVGHPRPGETAEVLVQVRALEATAQAEIRLIAPEMDATERFGNLRGLRAGAATRPRWQTVRGFAAGESAPFRASLQLPMQPGVYRLGASVVQRSAEPARLASGRPVQDRAYVERLVQLNSAGLVPLAASVTALPPVLGPTPSPAGPVGVSSCGTWTALYNNQDANGGAGALEPLVGLAVYYPDNTGFGLPPSPAGVMTDANGRFTLCGTTTTAILLQLDGADVLNAAEIRLYNSVIYRGPLGTGGTIVAPVSDKGRVYANFYAIMAGTRTFLGSVPPVVTVYVETYNDYSYYSNHTVHIFANAVWGPYGIFTSAHEYGHNVQDNSLGGIPSHTCPSPHYVDSPSNLSCAYTEGWADFYGLYMQRARLTTGYWSDNYLESNSFYPGGDGSTVEGAVAAFLYDVVDGSADPDGITGDDDAMQYPLSYLKGIVSTCDYGFPGVKGVTFYAPATGVDHLSYCFERQLDPAVLNSTVYFTTRSTDPIAYRESATEPGNWSQAALRTLWTHDLYGQ